MKASFANWVGTIVVGLSFAAPALAAETADQYPSRPIKFVVTYPPGGGTDFVARAVGSELGKLLGQTIIVDNRAGAGGTIGTNEVSKASPDGYTLLFGTTAGMIINPSLKSKMPYDPVKDFEPVTLLATTPQILVVDAKLPIHSTQELIDYAKKHPGEMNYASVGIGAPNHIAMEMFKNMTGTKLTHIPYKGAGPVLNDLLGGQVQVTFNPIPPMLSHIKEGKLRALAVTSSVRSSAAPDVPTVAESGVPGYEANFWYAVFVPAQTPKPIIEKLNAALKTVLADPKMVALLTEAGVEPKSTSPQELAEIMKKDTASMVKTIHDASITAE